MNPKSVVVFGSGMGHYPESVARGFRQNGMEAVSYSYLPADRFLERVCWEKLPQRGLTKIRDIWLERIVRRTAEAARTAELLVIIKGDLVPLDRYTELLAGVKCPKVLWLMDSIQSVRDGLQRASLADALLFFEGTDLPWLSSLPVPHHQVALAADPDWYFPTGESVHPWDISFFGAIYANRLSMLDSILAALPAGMQLRARFVGGYRSRIHPIRSARRLGQYPLAARYLEHSEHWTHSQINRLDNESNICLNVFHPQSIDSLNMRTFETCCSGAFLLCQLNIALSRSFALGREVESFETSGEAAEKIVFYLRHEDAAKRIAAAARERVLRDHTMRVRTQQILSTLKNDGLL